VVAGLAEHVGEHTQQFGVGVDVANPATLVVIAQHDLSDREADQLTVSEVWSVATAGAGWDDMVVDQHVKCGQEGVEVFGHT
jgi:hypothetical protein